MPRNNYAYIDGTNLHLTFEHLDWKVDYKKLNDLLRYRYDVIIAHYFLGKTANAAVYDKLRSYGYNVKLKEPSPYNTEEITCTKCNSVVVPTERKYKADVDSFLTMHVISDLNDFDKAVIITSDGDYDELVKTLIRNYQLRVVFAPSRDGCSKLLKRAATDKIAYINDFRDILEKV